MSHREKEKKINRMNFKPRASLMPMMRGARNGAIEQPGLPAYLGGDSFSRRGPAGTGRSLFMGGSTQREMTDVRAARLCNLACRFLDRGDPTSG